MTRFEQSFQLAAQKLQNTTRLERQEMAKNVIEKLPPEEQTCFEPIDEILFRNMKMVSVKSHSTAAYIRYRDSDLIFSQFNMSMVHMAFFEAVVVYPTQVLSKHHVSTYLYSQTLL
jgi:hypothetical protein